MSQVQDRIPGVEPRKSVTWKVWLIALSGRVARASLAVVAMGLAALVAKELQAQPLDGRAAILKLTVIDHDSGKPTPARVEILDAQDKAHIAADSLLIGGDCTNREVPWAGTVKEHLGKLTNHIANRYTGTEQFYSGGVCRASVPPGKYRVRVFKGLEYPVATQHVQLKAGATAEVVVKLQRWINLPKTGWYSGDSHLHISRPFKEVNPYICKWMQAEDIHVANLLQWGLSKGFHNTRQYAHGPDGLYHEGDYWLAAGQENPRSHFLGHTVILGATRPINFPDAYLVYQQFWQEARRQQALSGWAHYASYRGGQEGMAIDLLDGLIDFIEVLQFDNARYEVWYDALNLGQRLAPIAGTDYPCVAYLPGRERFYTRVEGGLTYKTWLEGIRRGRTFVTNGPMLELTVNGQGIGEELVLTSAGRVRVEARARWDPLRDQVDRLELVHGGDVVASVSRKDDAAELVLRSNYQVDETCWLAVRVVGKKLLEGKSPYPPKHPFHQPYSRAAAHTAAIYVTVKNTPPLAAQRRAKLVAAAWLERLVNLERRLAPDQLDKLARWPAADGVDVDDLRKNRPALLARIESAKKRLEKIAR